jgi:hypothetical protein
MSQESKYQQSIKSIIDLCYEKVVGFLITIGALSVIGFMGFRFYIGPGKWLIKNWETLQESISQDPLIWVASFLAMIVVPSLLLIRIFIPIYKWGKRKALGLT